MASPRSVGKSRQENTAPARSTEWVIERLEQHLAALGALDPETDQFDDPRVKALEAEIQSTFVDAFGIRSAEGKAYRNFTISGNPEARKTSRYDYQRDFALGLSSAETNLQRMLVQLEATKPKSTTGRSSAADSRTDRGARRVFLVHGRSEGPKEMVARFLEKLDLQPVILHEQPNGGRAIIDKFEHFADVVFAVVLLTQDDVGSLAGARARQPRARQNVIFELGYFIGRLGRQNVCALNEPGLELPSDFVGVGYIEMNGTSTWRTELAKEIRAAGIDVDLNRAI